MYIIYIWRGEGSKKKEISMRKGTESSETPMEGAPGGGGKMEICEKSTKSTR